MVQLEQEVDSIEFMSMSIYTKDAYMDFNSDYGVLVGRVIANGGIGIPNAKVSIFIPLSDEDSNDGEIKSIYPYKTPRDKNAQGKRYNLLPRVSSLEQNTGLYKPKQPFGSFPIKPEIVTNQSFLNVYKKYYKYTAVTNDFGDYMIFGVPIGLQTVHMSVDITDIGKYSMSPASMVKAGYPANLFIDGGKAIKGSDDLSDLPNIETQEISVEVIPFWGDKTNFIIGITRQDFRIRAVLESSFTIFGTSMTMGVYGTFGDPDRDRENKGFYALSDDWRNNGDIRTYRPSPLTIRVFTYNTTLDIDTQIKTGMVDITASDTIIELSSSEYYSINNNGDFLLNIPCNRRKVVTDGLGNETVVADDSAYGMFTRFYGMLLVEYPNLQVLPINKSYSEKFKGPNPARPARGRLKIPQSVGLRMNETGNNKVINDKTAKNIIEFFILQD
jgi:hypothetical protein